MQPTLAKPFHRRAGSTKGRPVQARLARSPRQPPDRRPQRPVPRARRCYRRAEGAPRSSSGAKYLDCPKGPHIGIRRARSRPEARNRRIRHRGLHETGRNLLLLWRIGTQIADCAVVRTTGAPQHSHDVLLGCVWHRFRRGKLAGATGSIAGRSNERLTAGKGSFRSEGLWYLDGALLWPCSPSSG
jgi:hypothetical protein